MVASRTGLTPHLRFRKQVLLRDRSQGVTHCPICNVEMDYKTSRLPHSAEPDHIVPISLGGTNHPSNGRAICRLCNQKRGNKTDASVPTISKVKASPIW